MSVYHTPRCRITWTNVRSAGVDRDVVVWHSPLILSFGLEFDPAIRRQARWFGIRFGLFSLGRAFIGGGAWTAPMNQLPGGSSGKIWVSMTWNDGSDVLHYTQEPILYRPSVWFQVIGASDGSDYEFAVAEEDHYIFGVHRHGFGD